MKRKHSSASLSRITFIHTTYVVSVGPAVFSQKNVIYSHVFHLFTDCAQVAALGKGKYVGAEMTDTLTTWNEFEAERKHPWGALEGRCSSSDGSPHRESASCLFSLQSSSLQILFK